MERLEPMKRTSLCLVSDIDLNDLNGAKRLNDLNRSGRSGVE
jgi:hypothetical protein